MGVRPTFQSPLSGKPVRYRSTRFAYGETRPNLRSVFTSKMRTHLPGVRQSLSGVSSGSLLGGSGDRRPPGNLKIERSFRSSPHLANRRRRRHLGSGLRPPPPPPSDDDVSSPLADDEDPEPLLPLLSLLPHQRDFFFKPNSNPTRPQHTATIFGLSRSRLQSPFARRTASENHEIADHSRVREGTRPQDHGSTDRVR